MNIEETKKAIEIMQAYVDGKEIEYRYRGSTDWLSCAAIGPVWGFNKTDYRVKPEPLEVWHAVSDGFISTCKYDTRDACRDAFPDDWTPTLFREVIE